MKRIMAEDVTLTIVDFSKEFILATDASDFAIGAVLLQQEPKGERPIYFFSRVLNEHEENYPTHEKELLAIVAAIEEFESYLKGKKFTVKTDSKCPIYLFENPHRNKRLVRQAINILDANFDVIYQPGKLNVVADALSRNRINETESWEKVPVEEFIKRHINTTKQVRRLIRQSPITYKVFSSKCQIVAYVHIESGKPRKSHNYEHIYSIFSSANNKAISKLIDPKSPPKPNKLHQIDDKHSLITVKPLILENADPNGENVTDLPGRLYT